MNGKSGWITLLSNELRDLHQKNWFASDIRSELRTKAKSTLAAMVIEGHENFLFGRRPVTNEEYAQFLNAIPLSNWKASTYSWINTYLIYCRVKMRGEPYYIEAATGYGCLHECKIENQDSVYVVPGYERHPVVGVNWFGAAFYAWALGFRLPTRQEWMLSAYASVGYRAAFSWGNRPPTEGDANYDEHIGDTTSVGKYSGTNNGIHDLCGNVREWCLDNAGDNEDSLEAATVGGCWNKGANSMRLDSYSLEWRRHSSASIGFRLCDDGKSETEVALL